jgi:hypothetical protein
MSDWIHSVFQTAALACGVASLLVVGIRGRRKEALRSIQALAFAAGRNRCSATDVTGDSVRSALDKSA